MLALVKEAADSAVSSILHQPKFPVECLFPDVGRSPIVLPLVDQYLKVLNVLKFDLTSVQEICGIVV
jgi:hypothetical protein